MTDTTTMEIEPPLHQQLSRVDAPMERKRVGDMQVDSFAGLKIQEYREAIEFAKLMAQGRNSIPPYLKQNPGDCLAVVTQALRWRLEPFWCAQHSYVAKAESLITYDAAVHAAIVLSSGIIKGRPRYEYSGEGDGRICTVFATFTGETVAHEYTTPPLSQCRPRRNEQGQVKGSPLWDKDPDQQLGYYAIRNWGRRHMPEVLGGVYDRDEFENTSQDETDVTPPSPNLLARLPGKVEGAAGFSENVVDTALAKEAELQAGAKAAKKPEKAKAAPDATAEAPGASVVAPATEPVQETKSAPKASPGPPKQPQTAGEYQAYADTWIRKVSNADDLEARWDGEKEMRAALAVPVAMRKQIEGMLQARTAELRKKRR